jgi:hypothetical protein
MKHKTPPSPPPPQNVFADGIATRSITYVAQNLPNIMLLLSMFITVGIAILSFMHAHHLFRFVKSDKLANILVSVFVGSSDALFFTFSLASAGLRRNASKLDGVLGKVKDEKGDERAHPRVRQLQRWANTFFITTLFGRLGFTTLLIFWLQDTGVTTYFNKISSDDTLNILIFLQVMNVLATFGAEGSAFLLNSNASLAEIAPTPTEEVSGDKHKTQSDYRKNGAGNLKDDIFAQIDNAKN